MRYLWVLAAALAASCGGSPFVEAPGGAPVVYSGGVNLQPSVNAGATGIVPTKVDGPQPPFSPPPPQPALVPLERELRPVSETALTPRPMLKHVVGKGDTLWSLAASYYGDGKKYTSIIKANPGLDPQKLAIGQELVIPAE
ncbi:MAG TPA: LysM peptidoglycan-binding domain-containing protein [Planctomycetes bacterium]|nr:LysM peptidoglycan-binding domain-containing protein [Planctomycetota bacterium]